MNSSTNSTAGTPNMFRYKIRVLTGKKIRKSRTILLRRKLQKRMARTPRLHIRLQRHPSLLNAFKLLQQIYRTEKKIHCIIKEKLKDPEIVRKIFVITGDTSRLWQETDSLLSSWRYSLSSLTCDTDSDEENRKYTRKLEHYNDSEDDVDPKESEDEDGDKEDEDDAEDDGNGYEGDDDIEDDEDIDVDLDESIGHGIYRFVHRMLGMLKLVKSENSSS